MTDSVMATRSPSVVVSPGTLQQSRPSQAHAASWSRPLGGPEAPRPAVGVGAAGKPGGGGGHRFPESSQRSLEGGGRHGMAGFRGGPPLQ